MLVLFNQNYFQAFLFLLSCNTLYLKSISGLYLQNLLTQFFIPVFEIPTMTDHQPHSENKSSPSENESPHLQGINPPSDQNLIEIQASKKKKEIISLDSSSQRQVDRSSLGARGEQVSGSTPAKVIKPKKVLPKCQLCKGTGKKIEMKNCSACKKFFHLTCLDQNEVKKKYICDKCRAQQQIPESKASKKAKKQESKNQQENTYNLPHMFAHSVTNNFSKLTQKKLEKEKKKDESNKTLEKFSDKYPYYISENNKIKYPIEDKLLFIYRDYFEPNENARACFSPPVDHPIIPSKYLGDFLQLQNFIVSFQPEFTHDYYGQYKKSVLYLTMNCNGTDKVFEQLLGTIIKIYMKDIYEKNKTQNVKILNDHCFFILLGTLSEGEHQAPSWLIAMVAQEIIRHLSTVPSMKDAFKNFQFPERLTLESKLYTLIKLIQGLSEVDGFHDMVSRKSEKISEMTKDKAEYVGKLKKNEAQALSNKQKIKQIQGRIDEIEAPENDNSDLLQTKKKNNNKEVQKNKKKSQKLSLQHENSSKLIKEYRQKIVQITKTIPFTISQVMFLGTDRNKSHHYFYLRQPHHLYVRYHSYLLDENSEFKIYEGKQKIMEYMKTLNNKGINEKHLLQNLTFLVKEDILRNPSPEELAHQMESDNIGAENYEGNFIETQEEFRNKIVNDVIEMQDKFSNYLAIKSCRWATQAKREQFKIGFPYIDNIQSMKQAVKTLQENFLFVEVVRQQEERNAQSDSNNEQGDRNGYPQQKEALRRRKPIRIWGINSERIKKFWLEYLELCIDYTGLWIIVSIFKNFVDRYLDKKLESIREQERRENLQREKQNKRAIREARQRENHERRTKQMKQKQKFSRTINDVEEDDEMEVEEAPRRSLRSNHRGPAQYQRQRRRPLTIDSDDEIEDEIEEIQQGEQVEQEEDFIDLEQQSINDDECGICKQVGDVICCDTCPKVYHLGCLKLKEVPQGDWSCMQCLQKMANTRQTRSRARMLNKE